MESSLLRCARQLSGLSQVEAARLAGTAQSALSAYESGSKVPTPEVLERILVALGFRPSRLLAQNRQRIIDVAARHHASNVRVFGSAARGSDTPTSDLDLLVRFEPSSSLFDLVDLADELEALLGLKVDVVSEGGLRGRHDEILREAVPL
jgi:predicted nucleotidyltransferase